MKKGHFIFSILFASIVTQNVFSASREYSHTKSIGYTSISFGPVISRIGDIIETNNLYGAGMSLGLFRGKISGIVVSALLDVSYVRNETFKDLNRWSYSDPIIGIDIVDSFGIENIHAKMQISLGEDFLIFKDSGITYKTTPENFYRSHFGLGVSIRLNIDQAKSKIDPYFQSVDPNKSKHALNRLDVHGFGMGLFSNIYFESDNFILVLLADAGISFSVLSDYVIATITYPDDKKTDLFIKANQDIGAYINIRHGTGYSISNNIYIGFAFGFEYEFISEARIREETIVVNSSNSISENLGDKLSSPLSKAIRGSLNFFVICSRS